MDADEGDDEEPAPIRPWKATSSYDIYMVDTRKEKDDDEERKDAANDRSLEKQPKRQCKRRSKSCLDRNNDHMDPALEQGEPSPDHDNTENQTEHQTMSKIIVLTTSHQTDTRSNRMPVKGLLPPRGV